MESIPNIPELTIQDLKLEDEKNPISILMVCDDRSKRGVACQNILKNFNHIQSSTFVSKDMNCSDTGYKSFGEITIDVLETQNKNIKKWKACQELLRDAIDNEIKTEITETSNTNFSLFTTGLSIDAVNENTVKMVINSQFENIKNIATNEPRSILVFDAEKSNEFENDDANVICELLYNSKHYKLTCVFAVQQSFKIYVKTFETFDYIFLFATDDVETIKTLYERYAGFFIPFEIFESAYSEITKKGRIMVIKNDCNNRLSAIHFSDNGTADDSTLSKIVFSYDCNTV